MGRCYGSLLSVVVMGCCCRSLLVGVGVGVVGWCWCWCCCGCGCGCWLSSWVVAVGRCSGSWLSVVGMGRFSVVVMGRCCRSLLLVGAGVGVGVVVVAGCRCCDGSLLSVVVMGRCCRSLLWVVVVGRCYGSLLSVVVVGLVLVLCGCGCGSCFFVAGRALICTGGILIHVECLTFMQTVSCETQSD